MSFAFNFQLDPEEDQEYLNEEVVQNGIDKTNELNTYDFTTTNEVTTTPCQQFKLTDNLLHSIELEPIELGPYKIYKRLLSDIRLQLASEDDLINTTNSTFNWLGCTDLIKYEYEGGFKTWESAIDLSKYLASLQDQQFKNCSVIELGCGSALPSLTFIKKFEPSTVHLSDFNAEVLRLLTIPNLYGTVFNTEDDDSINIEPEHLQTIDEKCKFWFGDWKQLSQCLGLNAKFDVVLTTETVYRMDLIPKLTDTLINIMSYPSGVCFLAAKNIYFGVGGGTIPFKAYLDKPDCPLTYREVFSFEHGVNREVLEVRWKH